MKNVKINDKAIERIAYILFNYMKENTNGKNKRNIEKREK